MGVHKEERAGVVVVAVVVAVVDAREANKRTASLMWVGSVFGSIISFQKKSKSGKPKERMNSS